VPLPSKVVAGWSLPGSPDAGDCVVNVMALGGRRYTSMEPTVNG